MRLPLYVVQTSTLRLGSRHNDSNEIYDVSDLLISSHPESTFIYHLDVLLVHAGLLYL